MGVPSLLSAGATFDFSFQGDLILGVISSDGGFVTINGAEIHFETPDTGINLGDFGSNIDLTINGFGVTVVFGGVVEGVPEPSTWAMMLIGFAGLSVLGWRGSRKTAAHAA